MKSSKNSLQRAQFPDWQIALLTGPAVLVFVILVWCDTEATILLIRWPPPDRR